jgi:hypothetical protein
MRGALETVQATLTGQTVRRAPNCLFALAICPRNLAAWARNILAARVLASINAHCCAFVIPWRNVGIKRVLSTDAEILGEQGLGHPGIELQKDIFES